MNDIATRYSQVRSEPGILKQIAAQLRQAATPAETIVWERLRRKNLHGLRFKRQHVLHGYIIDFYCHEKRLCIELDGAPHLEAIRKEKDGQRDGELRLRGYRVMRIMNEDALRDIDGFLKLILKTVNSSPKVDQRLSGDL
jgi:very-short-patch-repair endonuclease